MRYYSNDILKSWDGEEMFVVEVTGIKEEEKAEFEKDEMSKNKWQNAYFKKTGSIHEKDKAGVTVYNGPIWDLRIKGMLCEIIRNFVMRGVKFKDIEDSYRSHNILKACEEARYKEELGLKDEDYDWLKKKMEEKVEYRSGQKDKVEEAVAIVAFWNANARTILEALNAPVRKE